MNEILRYGVRMKKGFYLFFLLTLMFVSGCGQRGPLFLTETQQTTTVKPLFDVASEKVELAKPLMLELTALNIRGVRAQINQPLAKDWNTMLNGEAEKNLRFIVFESDLLNAETQTMLIGTVDSSGGNFTIPGTTYLRFRESEARYVEIPKMISAIRTFFTQNPTYKRAQNPVDFIMDDKGFIDIYMQIQLPSTAN